MRWLSHLFEVVMADEIAAPAPAVWVRTIQALSSSFTLIRQKTRLAVRMSTVHPTAIDVEVF
jgi:hypothetical protein